MYKKGIIHVLSYGLVGINELPLAACGMTIINYVFFSILSLKVAINEVKLKTIVKLSTIIAKKIAEYQSDIKYVLKKTHNLLFAILISLKKL